jgi:hypothetical protein
MILWSAALAAFLLALAWGAANWKFFDLLYCKQLLKSRDVYTRMDGADRIWLRHLRPGMTREEVIRLFHPLPVKHDDDRGYFVAFDGDALCFSFDEDGKLAASWWYP